MQTSLLYCSHCGAANDKTTTHCFACSSLLSQDMEKKEDAANLLDQRYRVLTSVGIGGFGTIYKVQDTQRADALFAIKQINLTNLSTTQIIEATEAFHREVHMLSSLHHENLPQIYDYFTDPQHWYIVMDFIEGETLEQYLTAKSMSIRSSGMPLVPMNEIIAIGMQLCAVLTYLHKQQPPIIFRDLKPANIMRTAQGHLFLIDFGIARQFKPGKTKDTLPLGSPGYAPPEQYGKAQTTPGADIYSFGALLHQFLSGNDPSEHPFQFAPLRMYGGSDLVELEELITRMVHMQDEHRPTINEVKSVFQHLQTRSPLPHQNSFATPHLQGATPQKQSIGTSINPSSPIQQQMPFSQASALTGRKRSRRKFALTLGAITLFGAGWLASSELSHITSPTAKNRAASKPSAITPTHNPPYANWIFEIGGLAVQPAVADGIVFAASGDGNLYAIDATSGQQKWAFAIPFGVNNTPLVANGILYAFTQNTNTFAIDVSSGRQRWSSSIAGDLYIPTIANGIIYVSSNDGNIYAVDATSGREKWSFQNCSILTVVDDVIYASSLDGNLHAVNATSGREKWSFPLNDPVNTHFTGLTVINEIAYGSLNTGIIHAIDAASGRGKWSFLPSIPVDASFPITIANNTVYIGSFERNVYAIDAETGRKKWAFQTGSPVYSAPAVMDGVVYVGSDDYKVYAIDAKTGRKKWAFQTGSQVQAPSTVMNGVVYIGSTDGNIYAIDTVTGKQIWAFATAGPVDYALTIVDAVIYVCSNDQNLYALITP